MKNLISLIAIAVFILLNSCESEPTVPPVNIISLVDYSASRDSSVANWYKEAIANSVIGRMGKKDRLVVLPVDFNSQTSSQEIFMVDFSKNDYSNEFAGLQKDEIEQQNHLDSVHSSLLRFNTAFDVARRNRMRLVGGTDIFGALSQAIKYVAPGCRNIVVIWSDMLQFTDKMKWNFEDHLNRLGEVEHYVYMAEKIDLQNLEVIVITGALNGMRPEKFKSVKSFWEMYFMECHGKLLDYSSGALSKLEDELTHKKQ